MPPGILGPELWYEGGVPTEPDGAYELGDMPLEPCIPVELGLCAPIEPDIEPDIELPAEFGVGLPIEPDIEPPVELGVW